MNVYTPPPRRLTAIENLLQQAVEPAGNNPLLPLGDFNAPYKKRGYSHVSEKGTALIHATPLYSFILCNDETVLTRMGTSVTGNTIPDLTFDRNAPQLTWETLPDTLGSDQFIIKLTLSHPVGRRRIGTAKLTNWPNFRQDSTTLPSPTERIELSSQCLYELQQAHTKYIAVTSATPTVDNHLDHLWAARRGLLNRWRRQKHNRSLKRKMLGLLSKRFITPSNCTPKIGARFAIN
ncbi:hypothetical protein HPB48_006326 [Haemaphysalis longicornis]|uniref:Endonuclease/exonuclease/phosphatase domain-containing protein n=1 Tax=Haemaphysalis longicornis TaxID=44386 RepID=A0A9J6FE89_HAELO|nr:hypothetical protein HPB48_006326 [Haemaphysalis longicornis]